MGKRISKVYTRTGDNGTTGLAGQTRVSKASLRISAIGDVDELNTEIGVLLATGDRSEEIGALLLRIQHRLFDIGGELAMVDTPLLPQAHVDDLEASIDRINAALPPLENFILPGGSPAAAQAHRARAVARRAERSLILLSESEPVTAVSLRYLNRLSDLLFVLARHLCRLDGVGETLWQQERPRAAS